MSLSNGSSITIPVAVIAFVASVGAFRRYLRKPDDEDGARKSSLKLQRSEVGV
jgi:hypothetical protein